MKAYIKAIDCYLPAGILTNKDLAREFPEWNVDKISAKVGVHTRHIASAEETATALAGGAAILIF